MMELLTYESTVDEHDTLAADDVYLLPTSFAQERFWFVDQLESGSPFYNVAGAFQVEGKLSINALSYAINGVVARHEVLRTIFPSVDGQPMQAVLTDTPRIEIPLIDLTSVQNQQELALELACEESRIPFDLTVWPLLRVSLIRLAEQSHILVINVHHIISDGWSMGVLIREVGELYSSYERGEESTLPPLDIQYADYAVWQRDQLSVESELEYWTQQLAGQESVELATDRARPAVQSYRGGRERLELSAEVTDGLKRISRQAGATLFTTLLAALRIVLWRHSGQTQSIIGTPVAGRNRRELESLIGLFINTLALRAELSEDRTFRQQLKLEREVFTGGFAHQEVPFHNVVERVQPERSLSHTPIFQVMFALQNTPAAPMNFNGLTLTKLDFDNGFTLVDLAVLLTEEDDGINGWVRYNADLYNKDTIARLISRYVQILSEISADPDRAISDLGRLNDADRRLILRDFNDTARQFPRDLSVCDLFLENVRTRPNAIALVDGDEQLTYEQLNRRANKLASYLIARGVEAEQVVGISLDRGVDLIVGLLAILKAGGAYLPLDPSSPARIGHMLRDAEVRVVISHSKHRHVALTANVEVLLLDERRSQIDLQSDDEIAKRTHAQNLCYVIYTSGSTGVPKGVMIQHSSLTNLVDWHNHEYTVTNADVATLLARQGFDASVWELWPYLCAGATLVVCDEEMSRSGAGLSEWMKRHGVTISFMATPLAEAVMSDDALSLRYLLTGGDQLKKYAPRDARYKLVNHYGPTESTVVTSSGEVTDKPQDDVRGPSIGKPIGNTTVYILDARREPVGIGVEGELCVAGEGLARGYARQPALTAERFIPDPFSTNSGERMYRTGDICRWTSTGEIEFVGRRDNQVKVRGYRIELGEIETAAMSVEWVEQAAVVVVETAQLGKQLVGFFAMREGEIAGRDLQTELLGRLPEYMKVARWEELDTFPLNANGKLDRRKLERQAVELLEQARERESTTEWTAIEEIVAGIWEEVLGQTEIGKEENFFDAGGHSLLATQIVTRINDAFGVEIGVRDLFESPTVQEISQKIEHELGHESKEHARIERVRRDQPLPLSFAQERFRFLELLQPGTAVYHMPAAVLLTGNLDVRALERALTEVRRRHEALRTRFVNQGERGVQVIEPSEDEALLVCDLEHVDAEQRDVELKKLIRQQIERPFDLSAGRLMRTSLLKVSSVEHVLVLVMHHIISDGWSMGVLIREVGELYSSYERGEESKLPELEIQYADYAAWQREQLSEREQLEYWTKQLAGLESVEIATDRARPAMPSYDGGRERLELSAEVTAGLKRVSRQAGATLFTTLLAAFKTLLWRYSGQEDISVGTLIAGRNRRETEKLIGLFINAVVLRTDLSGAPTFSELLKRVREVTLGAYVHQDLPFERLVDHLHTERDISRAPLFQILFLLQNVPIGTLELPGITLTPIDYYSGAVAYDLMISIREERQTLKIRLDYSKDLFDEVTIKRMLKHYSVLLEGVVANPEAGIVDLPLLNEAERKQLLVDWNDGSCPYPLHEPFSRLFELQVEKTPDAVAVRCGDESLTYRELNERANRLACVLRDAGVGPETVVALYARRGIKFLTAMLAIFKTSGAYLPIDPAYPVSRISRTIEQAQCAAVIAAREFAGKVASPVWVLEELIERDMPAKGGHGGPPLQILRTNQILREFGSDAATVGAALCGRPAADPNNLAYIIFTSGSTGIPKGAMIEQAGMINHLYAKITALGLSQSDVIAQTASQCFDISVWQFLAGLLVGAGVEIIADEAVHDPSLLLDQIEAREITILEVVPTLLRAILDQARSTQRHLPALRWVIPTGEALAPDLARQWTNSYPQIPLLNAYGPTECSDDVTHHRIDAPPPDVAHLPIGRPIPNMEAYILDRMLLPMPIGVPGELYMGGVGVGRGYVNEPSKTAQSFVPSPFGQQPGARLYKTGDLARYLSDGNIEYLGRVDQQVKIRGFRIETGEVEAALSQHPDVSAAVVAARTDSTGSKQLIAYVVPQQVDEPALRVFLKERLPEYMVPSVFVGLESFPLTQNGKIDQKALLRMKLPESSLERAVIAPQTLTQEHVAEIWKQVLEVSHVSIQDRFLDIGGDSMRIIRAYRALSELYPEKLTVADLFKYNTIESLGAFIDANNATSQTAVAVQGYEL